jgi:pimeloyl-ACP methyl ester carboxylesterase
MQRFSSNGIDIAFIDEGAGEPILLIHGFASTASVNWVATSWAETLKRAGRRIIALDNRGHGASAKLYDPALYRPSLMATDATNLLDHLGVGQADVMGYSMGARLAAFLAVEHSAKVRSLVIGGLGMALVGGMNGGEIIARALEASSVDGLAEGPGSNYRRFAEQTGSDLKALAACARGSQDGMPAAKLATLDLPVLVAVGERDAVVGSGEQLARLMPRAEYLEIPRRDHMLATGDKVFKEGVLAFLKRHARD